MFHKLNIWQQGLTWSEATIVLCLGIVSTIAAVYIIMALVEVHLKGEKK